MCQHMMTAAHMLQFEPGLLQGSEHSLALDDREPARIHRSGCNGERIDAGFNVGRYVNPVFPVDFDYSLYRFSRIRERLLISRPIDDDRGQRGNADSEAAIGLGKQMDRKASFRHSHTHRRCLSHQYSRAVENSQYWGIACRTNQ